MTKTSLFSRRFAGALALASAALALVAGPPSHAQTSTTGDGGAGTFAGQHKAPGLGDPNVVVPGVGSTTAWENFGSNPEGLVTAGEADAPGNQYLQVLGGGATNAARYNLTNGDDWLQRSMDLLGDPGSAVGDITGDASTSCRNEQHQETRTETSVYTCESGRPAQVSEGTCTRTYQPIFDTDYIYSCVLGTQWRAVSKTCEPERVVVVDEDYVYQCITGTVWTHTPASCERKRIVVVDEDYIYGCVQTWNGTSHAGNAACTANGKPGCVPSGGRTCTAPTGLPSQYICKEGYSGSSTTNRCSITDNTTVTWYHKWRISAVATGYAASTPASFWQPFVPGCTISEYQDQTNSWNRGAEFSLVCGSGGPLPSSFVPSPAAGEGYQISEHNCSPLPWGGQTCGTTLIAQPRGTATEHGGTITNCGGYAGDASCQQQSQVCVEPGGYRTINGAQVYRACWRYEVTYSCGTRTDYPGCAPPAGMSLSGDRCIATGAGGVCTGREKTYIDPAGGCSRYEQNVRCEDQVAGAGTPSQVVRDVISDTWDNGCAALAGNGACVKQGEVVILGQQTRVINGLSVTRNPWTVREDYICSSSSNVNSCAPFAGCTKTAETCASKNPTGSCTAYDRTYRCENPVNNGGTPVETPREVVDEYWTDPCAANRNDPMCSKTADQVVVGNETRVINGLSVTRNPWKRRETWTCNVSAQVDTCAPVATCQQVGEECGGTAPDGSCSVQKKRYRCENPVPEAGDPEEEPVEHQGGEMQGPPCEHVGNTACRLKETVCTQPGGTRIINGVPTTAACWEEQDVYECETTGEDATNCQPPSGCVLQEQQCLEEGPGECRTYENIYKCTREVVTEETRNTCETRVCIGQMCVGSEDAGDSDLPDALAALLIAQMAGEDYSKDLTIFKGQPMRCRKAVLGFRNCCKDSGWGVDLGIAHCSEEEKTLMTRQEAKSTHYVGTYCSQKSFFGVCLEKAMRYCAFEGTLARIVHEAGRPQVGKGWGTPKEADCTGFTIEEFQQLDLSNVDFSDFTKDVMKNITNPDPNSTLGRIQQSIDGLLGTGNPGPGDVNEAGAE